MLRLWFWLTGRRAAVTPTGERPVFALRARATRIEALSAAQMRTVAARASTTRIQHARAEF